MVHRPHKGLVDGIPVLRPPRPPCRLRQSPEADAGSKTASPPDELQVWANDMTELARMVMAGVMRKMSAVPDHHVGAVDRLAVEPRVDAGFVGRADRNHAVVDLASVIAQDPDVSSREWRIRRGAGHAVVRTRDDVVRLAGGFFLNPPFAMAPGIARAANLEVLVVPVR